MDGKITALSEEPGYVRLGSDYDIQQLKKIRDGVDAVLCGGATFRAFPKIRTGLTRSTPLVHGLLTQSWNLPLDAPFFQAPQAEVSEILVFSPQAPPAVFEDLITQGRLLWVPLPQAHPRQVVATIHHAFEQRGVTRLLVEGGGEILALFLEAQAIEELHLTLCPLLVGGRDIPSLVGGLGFGVSQAPRATLLNVQQVGDELYLHMGLGYPGA